MCTFLPPVVLPFGTYIQFLVVLTEKNQEIPTSLFHEKNKSVFSCLLQETTNIREISLKFYRLKFTLSAYFNTIKNKIVLTILCTLSFLNCENAFPSICQFCPGLSSCETSKKTNVFVKFFKASS